MVRTDVPVVHRVDGRPVRIGLIEGVRGVRQVMRHEKPRFADAVQCDCDRHVPLVKLPQGRKPGGPFGKPTVAIGCIPPIQLVGPFVAPEGVLVRVESGDVLDEILGVQAVPDVGEDRA